MSLRCPGGSPSRAKVAAAAIARADLVRQRRSGIAAAFWSDEPHDIQSIAEKFKCSETTIRRAFKTFNIDVHDLKIQDRLDRGRAVRLKPEVAKLYKVMSVEAIAVDLKTAPRVIRASIKLCIDDGTIRGPFRD